MSENRQLLEELVRGLAAVAGVTIGIYILPSQPIIALMFFVFAAFAIRGCAFCYLYGLFGAAKACTIRTKPTQTIEPK